MFDQGEGSIQTYNVLMYAFHKKSVSFPLETLNLKIFLPHFFFDEVTWIIAKKKKESKKKKNR